MASLARSASLLLLILPGNSSGFLPASRAQSMAILPPDTPPSLRCTMVASKRGDEGPFADEPSSSFDMESLRRRAERQESQYARLLAEQSNYLGEERPVPESVHIVLFRPDTPEQHVHTIELPKGSGNNAILAFESGGDCAAFAWLLKDLEFADPCPEETMFEPFRQYCEMTGVSLMIVPKGFELTPPQMNANDEDFERGAADDCDAEMYNNTAGSSDEELDSWG